MSSKRIKKPADVRAAVLRGRISSAQQERALQLGQRLVPELSDVALDPGRVAAADAATELALSLLAAVGLPADLVPRCLAALAAAPPGSSAQDLCARALVSADQPAVDAILARMEQPLTPGLARGLALVLVDSEDPRAVAALGTLVTDFSLAVAPALAPALAPESLDAGGKCRLVALLPQLNAALSAVQVSTLAQADELDAVYALCLAARGAGSTAPQLPMLMQTLATRAQELAAQVRADLQGIQALSQLSTDD